VAETARRIATALLLLTAVAHAADEREAFEKGLAKVTLQISGGQGKKARASLKRLLEKHRGKKLRPHREAACSRQPMPRVILPLRANGPVSKKNFTTAAAPIRSPSPTWAQPPPPQP